RRGKPEEHHRQWHQRSADAQSIQCLGQLYDRQHEGVGMSEMTPQTLIDFVYGEARMLDEQRFEEWLGLFTEDGHYWMPLSHGQREPLLQGSLMEEDTLRLRVRGERLAGQRTYAQQPKSRSHHLLQQPTSETAEAWHDPDSGRYAVRAAFLYTETRRDQQTHY